MQFGVDDKATRAARPRMITVLILCAFGYGLTFYMFYPGIMTIDARYIYADVVKNFRGDWQSPVMTALWSLIDPVAPGSASMFFLITALYWLAFALIGTTIARRSCLALALPIFALTPPAFVLVGVIWRDVLFAATWLLAAALVFTTAERAPKIQRTIQAFALVLVALGVLLRPNAIPAAPLLAAYILWPTAFNLKRVAILYMPAFVAFVAIVPLVYYGLMDAKRQHPLHGLLVFDLGGITYFAKENQFPASWTPEQTALLAERCYPTDKWDTYWYLEPCKFVMGRLEGEKIFGTDAMTKAWRQAIINHPVAYLAHRATFTITFLTGDNLVMWTQDAVDRAKTDKPAYRILVALEEALRPTWQFRPASWLLLCLVLCGLAWRRRTTVSGAFVLGVCGSAAIYVATYFFVGVASDYRYAYWATLAGLSGIAVLLPRSLLRE